jgi:hypothetical protein
VRKLVSKRRVGSKGIERHEAAQTSYQRVLDSGVPAPNTHRLEAQLRTLDLIALALEIQRTLDLLRFFSFLELMSASLSQRRGLPRLDVGGSNPVGHGRRNSVRMRPTIMSRVCSGCAPTGTQWDAAYRVLQRSAGSRIAQSQCVEARTHLNPLPSTI